MSLDADRRAELQEPKIRDFFRAHAHADQFDFGNDEAVSAVVFAHAVLQVGEAVKVRDFVHRTTFPHSRVPIPICLHKADDPAAPISTDGLLGVVLAVGDEMGTEFLVGFRAQGNIAIGAETLQRSVDFRAVELGIHVE